MTKVVELSLRQNCPRKEFHRYVPRQITDGTEVVMVDRGKRYPLRFDGRSLISLCGEVAEAVEIRVEPQSTQSENEAWAFHMKLIGLGYQNVTYVKPEVNQCP